MRQCTNGPVRKGTHVGLTRVERPKYCLTLVARSLSLEHTTREDLEYLHVRFACFERWISSYNVVCGSGASVWAAVEGDEAGAICSSVNKGTIDTTGQRVRQADGPTAVALQVSYFPTFRYNFPVPCSAILTIMKCLNPPRVEAFGRGSGLQDIPALVRSLYASSSYCLEDRKAFEELAVLTTKRMDCVRHARRGQPRPSPLLSSRRATSAQAIEERWHLVFDGMKSTVVVTAVPAAACVFCFWRKQRQIPDGWYFHYDPITGHPYYVHDTTHVSAWAEYDGSFPAKTQVAPEMETHHGSEKGADVWTDWDTDFFCDDDRPAPTAPPPFSSTSEFGTHEGRSRETGRVSSSET